jgi:HEAT repeat protein
MASRRIEEHLEQLTRLRGASPAEAAPPLRKALLDRSNLVAAKAARIAGESLLRDLMPDLLAAYDRLFDDPVKRDPQCWGKNAIAKALREMDYAESAPFLRGARHVQMEPVWGGTQDTAGALRGICLLALPGCGDIRREHIMRYLVDALAEADPAVRADAARAIGAMGGEDSALVLRLKAHLGDKESAVTGQVFESLLALERSEALDFVAQFLGSEGGERAEEAALALGGSRMAKAVDVLLEAFARALGADYRQAILRALGISRQDLAVEFLRRLAEEGRTQDREDARAALALFPDSKATPG